MTFKVGLFLGLLLGAFECRAQLAHNSPAMELANDNPDGDISTSSPQSDEFFGPVFYKVKKGETIESIANQFHLTTEQFNKWNFLPQGIKPGMKVAIRFDWQKKHESKVEPEIQTATKGTQYHRVVANETLYHLSVVYGVTVDQLKEWNHLLDNKITVNKELIVGK